MNLSLYVSLLGKDGHLWWHVCTYTSESQKIALDEISRTTVYLL